MYGTMIILFFMSFTTSAKDLTHLQAFLACEDKIESFKKKGCNYQPISVTRAKRISDIEFFKVDCGKSKLKGFVTNSKCVPKVITSVPHVSKLQRLNQISTSNSKGQLPTRASALNNVSGDSLIKINSSLKELIRYPRLKVGH